MTTVSSPDDQPDGRHDATGALDLPPDVAVVDARAAVQDWASAKAVLMGAFDATQQAARGGVPIVYVVHADDLLGRRGAPSAMMANGLVAAARTAAIELSREGVPVNVLGVADDTPPGATSRWLRRLGERGGPTGEVIHLDSGHLGKALS